MSSWKGQKNQPQVRDCWRLLIQRWVLFSHNLIFITLISIDSIPHILFYSHTFTIYCCLSHYFDHLKALPKYFKWESVNISPAAANHSVQHTPVMVILSCRISVGKVMFSSWGDILQNIFTCLFSQTTHHFVRQKPAPTSLRSL